MFNQLSGINAILYYLNSIFAFAGFSKVSSDLQSVAVGATNLIFTVIAMSVIDKLGRKTLLLVGSVGTCLSLAGVAAIFLTGRHEDLLVWMLIGFIAFFAFSGGYRFACFSAMMVVQFFVVLFFYPETKGISLEEMQKKLKIA